MLFVRRAQTAGVSVQMLSEGELAGLKRARMRSGFT